MVMGHTWPTIPSEGQFKSEVLLATRTIISAADELANFVRSAKLDGTWNPEVSTEEHHGVSQVQGAGGKRAGVRINPPLAFAQTFSLLAIAASLPALARSSPR